MAASLLACGFMLMSVAAASGQGTDPSADAVFRVGPLAFTPALSIPALGLDSNVFNDSENPRKDFMANVQPTVDAWLGFGPIRLEAKQQFNLLYFEKYASERAVNTLSSLRAELLLLWGTPYVGLSFAKTNDRADARIDTRAVNRTRPATVGIDFRLSSSTNLDLGVNDNETSFDADATFDGTPLQTALDRRSRNYRATLRYAVTPPTTFTLSVARQEERFRFSPQQDSQSLRVVPGLAFATDAVITGRVEVGWMSFKPRSGALRPFTGIVSSVDLGYVFLGLTRLQLAVNRDVTPSIDSVASYALQTGVTGTLTHRVSERWDVNISGRRQRLDFGQVRLLSETDTSVERADTVDTYSAGIGFYFTQGLRIGVRAESISRKSVLPIGRYDNLRILSSISFAPN
jgi:hypothetical protein